MSLYQKRRSLLGRLQRFVLATSIPPVKQIYIAVYKIIVWWVARRLYKEPSILAVYLKGGVAKGETVPGLSDIDFAAVVHYDDLPAHYNWLGLEVRTKNDWYKHLAERFYLLESGLDIYQDSHLEGIFQISYRLHYQLTEAKASWKLLHGRDYFSTLPELSNEALRGGVYTEMIWWWARFARHVINRKENWTDPLVCNGLGYRITCGVLKAALALEKGELNFYREGALQKAKVLLNRGEQAFVDRLLAIKNKRYLKNDSGLAEAQKDFLLTFMDRFYGALLTHPFTQPLKSITLRLDCPPEECWPTGLAQENAEKIARFARQSWKDKFRSAYLVPSIFFAVDDLLLLVEADPQQLPSLAQLHDLAAQHQQLQEGAHRRLHLFLLLPHAAFHFGRHTFPEVIGWNNLLTQACIPDAFELAGQAEFALSGGGYPNLNRAAWSPLVEFFARTQRMENLYKMEFPLSGEWAPLDFLRTFWKCAQLIILKRSSATDELVFALTPPAIERCLAAMGAPLPKELFPLIEAYPAVLDAAELELSDYLAPAQAYLNTLDPDGPRLGLK